MNGDLISRSALLVRLAKVFVPADGLGQGISIGIDHAIDVIGEAPAVDAEQVFEQMGLVKEAFEMAKADLVAVVRCKDCKRNPGYKPNGRNMVWCRRWRDYTPLNGFCGYGERRAGDAD